MTDNSYGLTTLALTIKYGRTPAQMGVSEQRLVALAGVIRALAEQPNEALHHTNQHTEFSADVRRTVRYLATLLPDAIPDEELPYHLWHLIGNPEWTVADLIDVMAGTVGADGKVLETPTSTLRAIASRVRAGIGRRAIIEELGCAPLIVSEVSKFLGIVEAREQALEDNAADHLASGGTVADFAARYRIARTKAEALLVDAAETIGLDPSMVVA